MNESNTMKKLFLVVSAIEVDNKYAFSFGNTRSVFSDEERFRQTMYTIQSIRNSYPEDKIVVLDTSTQNCEKYKASVGYFGAEYIAFKELDPEGHAIVTTHQSISYCECYMMNSFFQKRKKFINEFDFIIKATGRYTYSNFKDLFIEENKHKFFFKHKLAFEWNHKWNYGYIDLRKKQDNNKLYQYSTVLYAFGISNLNRMMDLFEAHNHVVQMTIPMGINYDIESLMYYFTRQYEHDIIETDWKVMGFEGVHGTLMYY